MTPKVINRTIAEACGWTRCVCNNPECDAWFPPNSHEPKLGVLNYCFDLNAMYEAEKVLTPIQQEHFGGFLYTGRICSFQDFCTGRMVFRFAHTIAAQRAEAFLRTIGKWIDAPTPTIRPTPENTLQKNP
jgi:hypothetical protein